MSWLPALAGELDMATAAALEEAVAQEQGGAISCCVIPRDG